MEENKFEQIHKGVSFKKLFVIVLVVLLVGIVIGRKGSHASYKSNISVPLATGKITYKHPDFQTVAMYQQASAGSSTYNEITKTPTSGYHINETKSYCNLNGVKDTNAKLYTIASGEHVFSGFSKGEKCYIYFDIATMKVSDILAKYTKNTSRNGKIANFTESTPTTVYSKADDDGTSYVFAGVNPNNWVKIESTYFRIIRFNGDGTMRLIYSGEELPHTSGEETQISKKLFNSNTNDNAYLGLQYTIGNAHGTGTNSTILGTSTSTDTTTLYGWYNSKIKPNYEGLIDINAGFCSDRDPYTNNTGTTAGGGTGDTETYYRSYITYYKGNTSQTSYTPVLTCKNASDRLKLPVGLITADEYMLAGGAANIWLHTRESYWTMSPYYFSRGDNYAYVWVVGESGSSDSLRRGIARGVRPVINLKTSTTFSRGTGTAENPYVVSVN